MTDEDVRAREGALALACLGQPRDEGAWENLYRRLWPYLWFVVRQRLGPQPTQTVDDVVQEVFIKVFRNLASFDPAKAPLRTWASAIARNEAVGYARSRNASHCRSESLDAIREELLGVREAWEWDDDAIERLRRRILQELGSHERMVFDLAFDGLTLEAIGDLLSVSKSAAGRTIQKIRKLIAVMAQELPDSR